VRDPELDRYLAAIEAHLSRLRGRDQTLTPPDFELARRWYEARIGLSTVLTGIDAAFRAQRQSPTTLAPCRTFVEALAAEPRL
jgi:hypothetical protein